MGIYDNRKPSAAYDNKATSPLEADALLIVADSPRTVTRTRKAFTDKMHAPTVTSAGPFTVRIDFYRSSSADVARDEKGSLASSTCTLLGVNVLTGSTNSIPVLQPDNTPTFAVDDILTDGQGNTFTVTSPPLWTGNVVVMNLQLGG